MAPKGHDPTWPDKAMFAALLLMVGSGLGILHGLLALGNATFGKNIPHFLLDYPTPIVILGSIATLLLAYVALRTQRNLFAYLGGGTAVVSMGFFGLVPLFGLLAIGLLLRSRMERETIQRGRKRLTASMWPDKALAASLFLLVAGLVVLFQAVAVFAGRFPPLLMPGNLAGRLGGGFVDAAVGLFCVAASREVYHVRRPWMGWSGATLAILTFGFYILGPALAAAAMVCLYLADREHEFRPAGALS